MTARADARSEDSPAAEAAWSAAWQAASLAATLAGVPALLAASLLRPGLRAGLGQRLGHAPRVPGRPAWVHAASLGEVRTCAPLWSALRRELPGVPLVISTMTATGAAAAEALPGRAAEPFRIPVDAAPAVARALSRLQPRALVTVEAEIWPNLFRACRRRRVPVAIVNGRIGERSLRWRIARPLLRHALRAAVVLAVRTEQDASRIVALGAAPDRVVVTGNLKFDAALDAARAPELPWAADAGLHEGPWIVLASTAAGEDELLLEAFRELAAARGGLRAVLAPRHPHRAPAIEARARALGLPVVRRSSRPDGGPRVPAGGVLLLDTVGELARLYRHAELVFVGGSLVARGGQNLLEPAAAGRPVLFGPHVDNFRDAEEALLASGGGARITRETLATSMRTLLDDAARRESMGHAARQAVAAHEGATARTVELLRPLLAGE